MNAEREEQIRARAHAIWEEEGRPDGKSEEHWQRACEEIGMESAAPEATNGTGKTATPKTSSRKPKAAAAETPTPVTGDGPQSAAEDAPTIAEEPSAAKPKRAATPRKPAEPGAKPRAGRTKAAAAGGAGSDPKPI